MKIARLVLLLPILASAQGIISTVAGTNPTYTGLNAVATKATLGRIAGTVVGSDGTTYMADPDNNVVVAVSNVGALAVVAGNGSAGFSGDGGPATQAALSAPNSVALDSSGNLYIADGGNARIRMVAKSGGIITTFAGTGDPGNPSNGPQTSTAIGTPTSLVGDPNGNLYFVANSIVCQLSAGNLFAQYVIYSGNGSGYLAYDTSSGNLYLSVPQQNQVLVGKGSSFSVFAGTGVAGYSGDEGLPLRAQFNAPAGIWVDPFGLVYLVDSGNGRIRKIAPNGLVDPVSGSGKQGFTGIGGAGADATFNYPTYLSGDSQSALVLSDTGNFRAYRVINGFALPLAGNGLYRFSGDGGPATAAVLNNPTHAVPDAFGNIYIADFGNNRIRKVDSKGVMTSIAGTGIGGYGGDGGPSTAAVINGPSGMVVDAVGNLYFSDTNNHRIRKISTSGIITTFAGSGTSGFGGDGGPSAQSVLSYPTAMAIDPSGTIYFVDSGNHRVRLVYSNGTAGTVAGNGSPVSSGDGDVPLAAGMTPTSVGVFLNADGQTSTVYIAEKGINKVRAVAKGVIRTIAGSGTNSNSGDGAASQGASVAAPSSLWADTAGNLFICTTGALRKIDLNGNISTYAGQSNSTQTGFTNDGSAAQGALLSCSDAVGDKDNNIFISDNLSNRIRKVTPQAPTMIVTPSSLSFTVAAFSSPPSQTVQLTGNQPGVAWVTSISTSDGTAWVSVDPGSGTIPSSLKVSISSASLAPGSYTAQIYILLPGGSNALATISVSLTVQPVPGVFVALPTRLIFLGIAGSPTSAQQLAISGTAGAPITASANSVGGNWLSVSPGSGQIPTTFNVTADASGLTPGTYQGGVLVGIPGSATPPTTVPVLFTVIAPVSATIVPQPAALNFTTSQGLNPAPQQLQITSTTSGATFTVGANAFATVTPTAGIVPGSVTVSVASATFAPGNYTAFVTIFNPAGNVTVPVNLTVTNGAGTLTVDPPVLPMLLDGPSGIAPVTLNIAASSGALSWTASVSTVNGGNWLFLGTANSASGTTVAGTPSPLTILVNESSLKPGIYTGSVTVNSGSQSKTVIIRAMVGGTQPILALSQTGLTFTTVAGANSLPTQSLAVLSNGSVAKTSSTLNWSASVVSGSSWLSVSPAASTANAGPLTVTANPTGLKAGVYTGLVRVSAASGAASPQYATAILNVLAAGATVAPVVQPQALFFATSQPQTITVSSGRSTAFQASVTTQTGNGISWLSASTGSITVNPGAATSISLSANLGLLAPGTYAGSVNITPSDGSPALVVAVTAYAAATSSCSSSYGLVIRQPGNNFNAQQVVPVTLEASLIDACGNAGPGSQIMATFSNGDPAVILNDLGTGIYQATWKPGATGTVTLNVRGSNGSGYPATSVSGKIGAGLGLPFVLTGGAVDAAAFTAGGQVAPGEIISVFGGNLGSANAQSSFPLPTSLSGITLTIGGIDAPLFFAGPGQVNAQVPFALVPNAATQVIARAVTASGEVDAVPETLAIGAARPGIFLTGTAAQGAILNGANQVVDATHPATAGDTIVVYCTGMGATTPASATGQAAVAGSLIVPATATIGGATATVSYAGPTPGSVGLYQVNLVVPAGVAGSTVNVVITQNGVPSNTATIAVKQ